MVNSSFSLCNGSELKVFLGRLSEALSSSTAFFRTFQALGPELGRSEYLVQKTYAGISFSRTKPGGQSSFVVGGLTGSELIMSTLQREPWPRWGGDQGPAGGTGRTWWRGAGRECHKMLSIEKGKAFGLGLLSDGISLGRKGVE